MYRQLVVEPRADDFFLHESDMSSMSIRPQACDAESIELELFTAQQCA